ncbi:MAG: helix-turn-helix domain-containing protein [Bacteroidota bacterium]
MTTKKDTTFEFSDVAQLAIDYINMTDQHVFLTGKAGTGKTTLLKHIIRHTHKAVVVAAPTGIAALNAGGVTLHSLLQLPFGTYLPENKPFDSSATAFTTPATLFKNARFNKNKIRLIQQIELLIIDEVSMLRSDLLDCIDQTLRVLRKKRNRPFGGVQILFIGDMLQLPPVVKQEEASLLKQYYPSSYFYDALALKTQSPIQIELQKIYRQTDKSFISLLNAFRHNEQTAEQVAQLNAHFVANLQRKQYEGYIYLTTHNYKADSINEQRLVELKTRQESLKATVIGDFPEHIYPNALSLELKEGAQVMFIKNSPQGDSDEEGKYYNGKIGKITNISTDKVEVISEDGSVVSVSKFKWENKRYTLNSQTNEVEETHLGSFEQFPLKLAWAVTIHKSQGLTFEKAILDLSGTFAPGQLYVALSRLTSLDGLVLSSRLPENPPDTDDALEAFLASGYTQDELEHRLSDYRRLFIINLSEITFDFSGLVNTVREHLATFNKSTGKSTKQKYEQWTKDLLTSTTPLLDVGQKFVKQVASIMQQQNPIPALAERISKAQTYFETELFKQIEKIRAHKESLKSASGVKKYLKELDELESAYLNQTKRIQKLALVVAAAEKNSSLDREQLEEYTHKPGFQVAEVVPEKKRPTAEVSYELYKEGLAIDEIAERRGFVPNTILSHLTQYVESGDINALELIDKEKLQNILKVKATGAEGMSDIKSKLGDEYSYGDIKLALVYDKITNS